jgi:hypothetical protein
MPFASSKNNDFNVGRENNMKYIVESDQWCRPLLRVKGVLSGGYHNIYMAARTK